MRKFVAQTPMKTAMIRTPASGPEPANTLAYIAGKARGDERGGTLGKWDRVSIEFRTEFRIDGFLQAKHEWYKENTLVSATAMLRFLNTTTDLQFGFAVDHIEHFIDPDGTLGFICEQGVFGDDDAWFAGGEEMVFNYALSAWILLFEPREERPPSGWQRSARLIAGVSVLPTHVETGFGEDEYKSLLAPRFPEGKPDEC